METTIHDVNKIRLGELSKLSEPTYTRRIFIETERGEKLEITCFGKEEDLKVEVQKKEKL